MSGGYHLVITSAEGEHRFAGEARPFNGPLPAKGRGIRFTSRRQARAYARQELTDIPVYAGLTLVDSQGAIVAVAVPSRRGGTGGQWKWGA